MARKQSKVLTVKEIKKRYNPKPVLPLSQVKRAAHFFNWAAENYPHQWIPWNWTQQAINGYARTPALKSEAVHHLRNASSRIREHLLANYHRTLIAGKGLGARASVDDADVLKAQAPKNAGRIGSAIAAAEKTAKLIRLNQIPDTAENRPWKGWYRSSFRDVMKKLGSSQFKRKLLAPLSDEDKKKKKGK